MTWLVIRTVRQKESAVAKAIAGMGYETWLPLENRWRQKRKNRPAKLWQSPVLSTILFAALPEAVHGDLQRIRYFEGLGRDAALQPITIPHGQITAFMAELECRNRRVRRLYEIATQGRQTIKPVKYRLGAGSDAPGLAELAEIIKAARFGEKVESEAA